MRPARAGRSGTRTGVLLPVVLGTALLAGRADAAGLEWPEVTRETRPWTRWWWMGSSVDPDGLSEALEDYRAAGLGGVEITPIYGVRGFEERFVPFLSPQWLSLLGHAVAEAGRLDLGVDLATGTGWPFGGPWVGADHACKRVAHRTYTLRGGERLAEPVRLRQEALVRSVGNQVYEAGGLYQAPGERPQGTWQDPRLRANARKLQVTDLVEPVEANANLQALALDQVRYPADLALQALVAYSAEGDVVDLSERVGREGALDWVAPPGRWTLYAVFQGAHGKMVERAAPGGEGNVIDHFSAPAIRAYLARFDRAFAGRDLSGLRAFFNDSYEVDDATGQADWTPALFEEFQRRRGYDLRRHLAALFGDDDVEKSARVLSDYRETVSDLLLETFTAEWSRWSAGRGAIVRNQAHGSPGSLLDLYAASDIPETEGTDLLRFKWAASAANVSGRRLVAAEAATWLGEHFRSTLADVRRAVDRLFLGGVNHVVYHGTNYSPAGEPWPGWLFYASVHFNPQNPWWSDFAALNAYVTRVQSFLQSGRPDNDVLLYFPLYDSLARRGNELLVHFGTGRPDPQGSAFEEAAGSLQERGYAFDYVSDRQILRARAPGGRIATTGGTYRAVLVPECRFVPLQTFDRLLALAHDGATVAFWKGVPADVAGLADLDARRSRYRGAADGIRWSSPDGGGVKEARVGSGRLLLGDGLERVLSRAGVGREEMVDRGLRFIRRRDGERGYYFVVNSGATAVNGWVPLRDSPPAVALFDPMRGSSGWTPVQGATGETRAYLQLEPGESAILATAEERSTGSPYPHYEPSGAALPVDGTWTVRFVSGGPDLPPDVKTANLPSWTRFGGDEVKRFSGTASYTIRLPRPPSGFEAWRLDLGRVGDSASVRLNGRDLGTLIGPAFHVQVDPGTLGDINVLEVQVSNLMANRIADLDRREVPWKKFYNVNLPSRLERNRGPDGLLDGSAWEPLDSGLMGPVTLTPLRRVAPAPRDSSR